MRRAQLDDAAAIAEVHTRSWESAYAHAFGAENLATIDVSRRRDWWERCIARGEGTVLVAELEGSVVAFASVGPSRDADAEGELYAIYALPQAWGSGVGSALMDAGVAALRDAGYRDAVLYVLDDNPRARRFYEREGWSVDGVTKRAEFFGIPITEVRYRLELG